MSPCPFGRLRRRLSRRMLLEGAHARCVALLLGILQRGLAVLRAQLRIRARPQQTPHDGGAVEEGGEHQRGVAVAVLQVDLRAVPQQQIDQPLVACCYLLGLGYEEAKFNYK